VTNVTIHSPKGKHCGLAESGRRDGQILIPRNIFARFES
jgi:hypothetical protein